MPQIDPGPLKQALKVLQAKASPDPGRRNNLRDLLGATMSAAELHRWLAVHPSAGHLRPELPPPGGQEAVAYAGTIVDLLEQRGSIHDWFFRDLYNERPDLIDQLRPLAIAWGCRPPEPSQWSRAPRRRGRRRLGLLAAALALTIGAGTLAFSVALVSQGLSEAEAIALQYQRDGQRMDTTSPRSQSYGDLVTQANRSLLDDLENLLLEGAGTTIVEVPSASVGEELHRNLTQRFGLPQRGVRSIRLGRTSRGGAHATTAMDDLFVRGDDGRTSSIGQLPFTEWQHVAPELPRGDDGAVIIEGLGRLHPTSANEILTGLQHSQRVRAAVVFSRPEGFGAYLERNRNQPGIVVREAVAPTLRSPQALEAAARALTVQADVSPVEIRERITTLVDLYPHLGQALDQPMGVACLVRLTHDAGVLSWSALRIHQSLSSCHLGRSRRMQDATAKQRADYLDLLRSSARMTIRESDPQGRFTVQSFREVHTEHGITAELREVLQHSDLVELDGTAGGVLTARFAPRWLHGYLACEGKPSTKLGSRRATPGVLSRTWTPPARHRRLELPYRASRSLAAL